MTFTLLERQLGRPKRLAPLARQELRFPEFHPGDHGGGVTPVPIPNTAVKPSSADGTASARLWDSRPAPTPRRERQKQTHRVCFALVA